MKKRSISGIIAIAMTCFTMNISADEIGIGFGINTSAYKSFDDNRAKYQKYNIPSPIEITFKKDLIGILGLHSGLQFSKKATSIQIQQTIETFDPVPDGVATFEEEFNYGSLEISPILSFKLSNFLLEGRSGLCGEFYINEKSDFSDN